MKYDTKKILYATGLSEMAPRGFRYALAVARQCDAEVICLHVINRLSVEARLTMSENFTTEKTKAFSIQNMKELMEEMLHRDEKLLSDPELARLRDVKVTNEVVQGVPEEMILRVAEETGVDLIIVGAHQKGRIKHNVLGSVARRVLRRSSIPVTLFPIPKE